MYNLQKFLKIRVLVNRLWRYLQKCECVSVAAVVCLCVCVWCTFYSMGVEEYINKLKSEQKSQLVGKDAKMFLFHSLGNEQTRENAIRWELMRALTLNELSINTGKNNELKCIETNFHFLECVFIYVCVFVPDAMCHSRPRMSLFS